VIEPEREAPAIGAFIVGILVGLLFGGTAMTLILFLAMVAAGGGNVPALPFIIEYAIATVALVGAIVACVRMRLNFWLGLWIGLAAGMLGGTALCNLMTGGLGNMH